MISKHLRMKILGGALILVLMVSFFSNLVVSLIVNRQNKAAVMTSLDKGLTITRDELLDTQEAIINDLKQMVEINQIGEQIKFIADFGGGGIVTITQKAHMDIANAALERSVTNSYSRIEVYNIQGMLHGFSFRSKSNIFTKGYYQQKKYNYKTLEGGIDSDEIEWKQVDQNLKEFPAFQYSGNIPNLQSTQFLNRDSRVEIRTILPITIKIFNETTQADELKQVGFIVASKALDKGFMALIARLTGMNTYIFAGKKLAIGNNSAYDQLVMESEADMVGQSRNLSEQNFIFNTVDIDKDGYFQGILPLYNGDKFMGALALLQSDSIVRANTLQLVVVLILVGLACMLVSVPLAIFVSGKIVRPIIDIVNRLKDIAEGEGDLTKRLKIQSKDEIGQVATWFNAFIEKVHGMIKNVSQNSELLKTAASNLAEISEVMDAGSEQTSQKTNAVASAVQEMSATMSNVASSMSQAAGNVNMVATATEQMSTTINEISQNAMKARDITMDAVTQAQDASGQVGELGDAATDIGKVVETITEISEQVNLLSLNATIEAARAGEAGKGFAVVANEIKELANQTAAATNDIKNKVGSIRNTTGRTVDQISNISSVVNKVNEIVVIITSAVEEQSATTHNISENVAQVSQGIEEVNHNISQSSEASRNIAEEISEVTVTADEMSRNSTQIKERSVDLSLLSSQLGDMVGKFKI